MIRKVKQFFSKATVKKLLAVAGVLSMMACMGIGIACSAEEATTTDIVSGVQSVTDAVTSQFSISTIASIVGVVLAACVGLFLFWWGARKVVRMIMSAFKKGKISL